jgi:pyruvate/2-oxoglutarate dehydrogenase complex dihydrolipoamide dehydrogenase (E3) component
MTMNWLSSAVDPPGKRAPLRRTYFGHKTIVIEACCELGGACINWGTLASKTLRESALFLSGFRTRSVSDSFDGNDCAPKETRARKDWSTGVLESWSIGVLVDQTQYSNTPFLRSRRVNDLEQLALR